jgi:uncharacterized membrane protein YgcG
MEAMMKKFICLLLSFLFILTSCTTYNIKSYWKDQEIKIDGNDNDWKGKLHSYGVLSLGCINDEDYLYICITSTNDNAISQLTGEMPGQTFTVWFYPFPDSNAVFGLRFSNESQLKNTEMPDGQNIAINVLIGLSRPQGPLSGIKGAESAFKFYGNMNKAVCELKIPLNKTDDVDFAINPFPFKKVKNIRVSFEGSLINDKKGEDENKNDREKFRDNKDNGFSVSMNGRGGHGGGQMGGGDFGGGNRHGGGNRMNNGNFNSHSSHERDDSWLESLKLISIQSTIQLAENTVKDKMQIKK